MSIYSFQMATVSKAKRTHCGRKHSTSVAKKCQYNSRTGAYEVKNKEADAEPANDQKVSDQSKYNLREEQFEDRHEDEIVFKGSGHMPKWPKVNPQENDQHYWDACDKYERSNGRLARTFIVALPREMTDEQRFQLADKFMKDLAHSNDGQPLPFSFAIHQDADNHNPHMHAMISERVNDNIPRNASTWFKRANPTDSKSGGARKTEDLKSKSWLYGARKRWETACNDALEKAGSDSRVDCRTLAKQGIDRIPTVHMGSINHMSSNSRASSPERIAHNLNVKELLQVEQDIKLYKAVLHVPTNRFVRIVTDNIKAADIASGKNFEASKRRPFRQAKLVIPPQMPKSFTTAAIMDYFQRIANQISESIRQTIQMEIEQQKRIQAMYQDLKNMNSDWRAMAYLMKSERHRDHYFKKIEFRKKHDPALSTTATAATTTNEIDETMAILDEVYEAIKDLPLPATSSGYGLSSSNPTSPSSSFSNLGSRPPLSISPPKPR